MLDEPYTRQLDGHLRKLRFYLGRSATRVTYWIAPGRRIILRIDGTAQHPSHAVRDRVEAMGGEVVSTTAGLEVRLPCA